MIVCKADNRSFQNTIVSYTRRIVRYQNIRYFEQVINNRICGVVPDHIIKLYTQQLVSVCMGAEQYNIVIFQTLLPIFNINGRLDGTSLSVISTVSPSRCVKDNLFVKRKPHLFLQ